MGSTRAGSPRMSVEPNARTNPADASAPAGGAGVQPVCLVHCLCSIFINAGGYDIAGKQRDKRGGGFVGGWAAQSGGRFSSRAWDFTRCRSGGLAGWRERQLKGKGGAAARAVALHA